MSKTMKNVYKLYFIYLFISIPNTLFSQCTGTEPALFLGNDTTFCSTPSLTLTAPAGYTYYDWSDNTHLQTLNVTAAGTYSVEIGIPSGNLVTNGNFELGNTGFTTDYIVGTGGAWGPLSNAGTYGVSTSPSLLHSNFSLCSDHTAAPGTKMLVVNGAGTPNSLVWSQTITVTPSTDYLFGAWVMNALNEPNVGILQFFINGVAIGPTFSSGPTACVWTQFADSWNSGGSSLAVLKIINQNSVNTGNDFALDDITFSPLCKKTDTIIIGVSTPPVQTTTLVSPSTCTGTPNGSITITSATGTQYSFDGGVTWQTSNVKSGLSAGTYTVMTKNSAGCTVSSVVTLVSTATPPIQTTTLVSPSTCTGPPDGSITITSTTGTQYSFNGGTTWQPSNIQIGLVAGIYTVMTQDAVGCTVSSTVTLVSVLTAPTQTTALVSPTPCTGIPDGSITITSPTGTQFSFDGGTTWQASNTSTGLAGGSYTVMSQNASGCTVSSIVTLIVVTSTITQTTSFVPSSVCTGVPDGSITITSATAVQYSFDGGVTWQVSNIKTALGPATYTVMSKDASGCTVSSVIVLTGVTNSPVITVSSDVVVCQNGVAMLSATATGGTSFTYHWDDFAGTGSTQIANPTVTGYYGVTVENQSGCISAQDSILVTVLAPLSAVITSPVTVCPDQATTLSVNGVSGGLSPYTVTWSSGASIIGTGTSISTSVAMTTPYTIAVTDACGSTPLVLNTAINVTPFVLPPFQIDINAQCEPAVFNLVNSMLPSQVQSSVWEISSGESFINQNSITLVDYLAGIYDVTLSVISVDGCKDTIVLVNALTVYPKPNADFTFNPLAVTSLNPVVNFVNQSSGASTYTWSIESGNPGFSTIENVTSHFPQGEPGSYDVVLFAETDHNCVDSTLKVVLVIEDQLVYVPNTFTPNGDDKNSTWKFYVSGYDLYRSFEMSVYNRWGEMVWKTNDVNAEWDGNYKGSVVTDGVYTWSLVTKDVVSDRKSYFNGSLNVIK